METLNSILIVLAVIVFCVLVYVLDSKREKARLKKQEEKLVLSFNNKYSKYTEDLIFSLEKKGLNHLLLTDYDAQPVFSGDSFYDEAALQRCLKGLLFEFCHRTGLPPFVNIEIEYADHPKHSGLYTARGYDRKISVFVQPESTYGTIVATFCHEFAHYFMDYHGISDKNIMSNEVKTDIIANLIGFNKLMIYGYEEICRTRRTLSGTETTSLKTGYISAEDCQALTYILRQYREYQRIKKKKALDLENARKDLEVRISTAVVIAEYLRNLDPRKVRCDNVKTLEQVQKLNEALREYEVANIDQEIGACRRMTCSNDVTEVRRGIYKIEQLCIKMLKWSNAFQGIGEESVTGQ